MNLNFWFERERESIEIDRGADCSACKYALLTHHFPSIYPLTSSSYQHPPLPINIAINQFFLSAPTTSHQYSHSPELPINTPLPINIPTIQCFLSTPTTSHQYTHYPVLPFNTNHFPSIYPPTSASYQTPFLSTSALSTLTTSHQYTHYPVLPINTHHFPSI
jgi:hypothetical protein